MSRALTVPAEALQWNRSTAFIWMKDNFETLQRQIGGRRVRWSIIVEWLFSLGITSRDGQRLKERTARETWYRVRLLVAREAGERAPKEKPAMLETRASDHPDRAVIRERINLANEKADEDRARRARVASYAAERDVLAHTPREVWQQPTATSETSGAAGRVKIGQISQHVVLMKQAPRYGADRELPLPPPYEGPRPDGMPDYLPLEALMPLSASGRKPDGNIDFEQMPGLPRRSFFENRWEWARACIPMLEAIPREERSLPLKGMLELVKSIFRNAT